MQSSLAMDLQEQELYQSTEIYDHLLPRVAWEAFPNTSQETFLNCPVFECLYSGTRGPGKSDGLIMTFAKHVDQGYGSAWRGIVFRRTFPELADIEAKTNKWFRQIFPGAIYNASSHTWRWPDGEELLLRYMMKPKDYWNYHGHEYPFVGWEELTNWPDAKCYDSMKACCRSTVKGMPRLYRGTTNPYGPGHNWVKQRFIDAGQPGEIVVDDEGLERTYVLGFLHENKALAEGDPEYMSRLKQEKDKAKKKAWTEGSWDIVAGGSFDDLWLPSIHKITPTFQIPSSWYVDRSYDDGEAAPYSVGFWAESDGTEVTFRDGSTKSFPPGTIFRIGEVYGWTGEPNEGNRKTIKAISDEIKEEEEALKQFILKPAHIIHPGPADNEIFNDDRGNSTAKQFSRNGIEWTRSNKKPGSRVAGRKLFRTMLEDCLVERPDSPGFYVFGTCVHWLRTVPVLPRCEKNPDDVDTNTEDHNWDETRYRILKPDAKIEPVEVTGR